MMRSGSRIRARWAHQIQTVPPHAYFVVSAVFHYLGPAFAVLLFARVDVLGVAWLRIASAAVIFGAWRRPWRGWATLAPGVRRSIVAWGFVLAAMNSCFYIAIDRLSLSTVAAIEFVGPVVLSVLGIRSARNALAVVFAGTGVYILTGIHLEGEPLGFVFALANAFLFTLYIMLGHRVAQAGASSGIDALGLAMLIAAVTATPLGIWDLGGVVLDPIALLSGIGVGISSSVIPYVFDQLALARLPRSTYALFVSLLPATATVVGIVILNQIPTAGEVLGVALVIAGVAMHQQSSTAKEARPSRPSRPLCPRTTGPAAVNRAAAASRLRSL